MARQNVGTPKFYIDLLSYYMATGTGSPVPYPEQYDSTRKLFGLNPSDPYNQPLIIGPSTWANFDFYIDWVVRTSWHADAKYFVGILGHNFKSQNFSNLGVQIINNNNQLHSMNESWDEICNFPTWDSPFEYNGWSLAESTANYDYDHDTIRIRLKSTDLPASMRVLVGSFAYGYAYEMPHSPDLKLTITREYDGIKSQQTRGGSTLTQINYASPPNWVGQPAWGLTVGDVYDYWNNNDILLKHFPMRGRKSWDLKFSYMSSNDLFPLNERRDYNNPTDSSTNEAAGYDTTADGTSADFFTGTNPGYSAYGNFKMNMNQDWNFMSTVMEKSIGGSLPFIFQPDSNNNSPDQFAICVIDQESFKYEQVANGVYNISLKIREVW